LPPHAKLIHNTNDPRDLNKTYETDVALLGDAKLTLAQLNAAITDRLGRRTIERSPQREIARARAAWLAKWQAKLEAGTAPISPYRVIAEFQKTVDAAEVVMTHDSGSPREQLLPFYRSRRPRGYLGWGKSHQLGTGLGLIIGAKVAAPDKFCVNIMGDAAFGMTGLDFETAVRCGVPILTIVFNNASMAIETRHMGLSHARHRTRDLGGSYAALARDLGGWSEETAFSQGEMARG
jgi:thiamine pyrophosphate-dependent acetolactate synthase large subunit-like protein